MDITHVYWCIKYDTFEVFTCTADLFSSFLSSFFFSFFLFFIDHFFFFLLSFLFLLFFFLSFFSLGAAIGYLMQIFSLVYISCMTRGSYCQVVCSQLLNDRQFRLFWTPVFSTRIRLEIVVWI